MTRAAGVARSFLLVCFSADAFNFYPVCVAHGMGGGEMVGSRECQKERGKGKKKKKKKRE